jgi:hypothetical protein
MLGTRPGFPAAGSRRPGHAGCSRRMEARGTVAETQASFREETIQARTLDSILAEHHGGEIHFLRIDVEGAEADVLAGLSLDRHRPWIIVLESMAPRRQVETHAGWEPGLLAARYEFVYADGLNRFYLAAEHAALRAAFTYPPTPRPARRPAVTKRLRPPSLLSPSRSRIPGDTAGRAWRRPGRRR